MIGICTDSNAQLPPELVDRYGIEVVPLTVTVDGVDHLEHVELDADAFYAGFGGGRAPEVSTAAPSPGQFAEAYGRLADAGADEILSVHIGADVSATFNSARLAAGQAPVPVRLVDSGTASFAVGCAVWQAADAVAGGADLDAAAAIAADVASGCGNVFVVGTLAFARGGGRLADDAEVAGIPVLELAGGKIRPVTRARSADDAAAAMAELVLRDGAEGLRVGVGHSDASSTPVADALAAIVGATGAEVVRYRVGPSVGVHTGPGTAGAVFHRVPPN